MAEFDAPIQVPSGLASVRTQVEETAEEVDRIRRLLIENHSAARGAMGESKDLEVFDEKFYGGMDELLRLSGALGEFSAVLGKILVNYRSAQRQAVSRAEAIPR